MLEIYLSVVDNFIEVSKAQLFRHDMLLLALQPFSLASEGGAGLLKLGDSRGHVGHVDRNRK
jgi:hypothetical protein